MSFWGSQYDQTGAQPFIDEEDQFALYGLPNFVSEEDKFSGGQRQVDEHLFKLKTYLRLRGGPLYKKVGTSRVGPTMKGAAKSSWTGIVGDVRPGQASSSMNEFDSTLGKFAKYMGGEYLPSPDSSMLRQDDFRKKGSSASEIPGSKAGVFDIEDDDSLDEYNANFFEVRAKCDPASVLALERQYFPGLSADIKQIIKDKLQVDINNARMNLQAKMLIARKADAILRTARYEKPGQEDEEDISLDLD
ncbi:hypothetical protein BZA70DRAFT_275974 [Myxozyma melibiosi]|uniref:Uncharacterized protein n=1 Tax=Myxozyma melibiosi TaxID=54550 RepID=A0ABR1F8M8_9ASCO